MKTVTLDYDLYKKELQGARAQGAESVQDLAKKLATILTLLNDEYSRESFTKAKYELNKLWAAAKGVEDEER